MAERKTFLLRIDTRTFDQLRRWAADEMRSVNGQIEFLLRESLRKAGRLKASEADSSSEGLNGSRRENP